jgi:hypothetical protein
MKETDPDKSDELCAEIWQALCERDEVKRRCVLQAGMVEQINITLTENC